ncbi:MAG: hypothetical protein J6N76_00160, partial [Lachnospiraceae bacterium]|nr:hypothetical protein [Lachnospiraceae bacterium]
SSNLNKRIEVPSLWVSFILSEVIKSQTTIPMEMEVAMMEIQFDAVKDISASLQIPDRGIA